MRKIFLSLIIFIAFIICGPLHAQKAREQKIKGVTTNLVIDDGGGGGGGGGGCNATPGSISITASGGVCPGNNSTTITISGTPVGTIQWYSSTDNVNFNPIDGATANNYSATNLSVTTYFYERASTSSICNAQSNTVTVTIGSTTWYKDADNDGYSDGTTQTQCEKPTGYKLVAQLTSISGDCNDDDASVHPGATEIYDGKDNDCDGAIDEGWVTSSLASSTVGFQDYIIPTGISSINMAVQGAKGGSFKFQSMIRGVPGLISTVSTGGTGGKLNAKFKVETNCQEGLKPGGTLRLIVGATPAATTFTQSLFPNPLSPIYGQGGGGGSAILYKAPGATEWEVLIVAGGGGGATATYTGTSASGSNGIAAIQQNFDLTKTGPNGMGGKGRFTQQEIEDGTPRDGGTIIITNISGGGGGAFGDATENCGGGKGLDANADGGVSTLCSGGILGGSGFGAGGSGITGGGGGGGYSGGNGGNEATGGFGAGSFANSNALNVSWLTPSNIDNGQISITTTNGESCCNPISLGETTLDAIEVPGCGTDDIAATTFAYSASSVNLTPEQYNTINFAIAEGSCDLSSVSYIDVIQSTAPGNIVVSRTFTLTDVNGHTATANAVVAVLDKTTPTVLTKNITVELLPGGKVTITAAQIDNGSFDACGIKSISLSQTDFYCDHVGDNTVTLTVTDVNGNVASATAIVTLVDKVLPRVFTQNIVVQLDASGSITVNDRDVDAGSYDECGLVSYKLDKTTFNCSNTGDNTVALTVTDINGNKGSGTAIVTVVDNIAPTVLAKNITAQITQGGDAIITTSQVDNGSYDACGGVILSLSKYTFYCEDIGPNTVTLTATDASGNTATTTATVTVEDHVPPTMFTRNITVQLDATGSVTVSHYDVDNGSYDACGIQTFSLSKYTFNCGDVGANTVTLTAIDANGNTSTATAIITVEDKIAPAINCPTVAASYNMDAGKCYTKLSLTATASDNCGEPTIQYKIGANVITFPYDFTVGSTTVTVEATDANGMISTCSYTINVVDNQPPVITCPTPASSYTTDAGQCTRSLSLPVISTTDNCVVPQVKYYISDAEISFPYNFPFGTTTVRAEATDVNGLTNSCTYSVNVNKVTTTTSLVVSTTPATNPVTQQYSDKIKCVATVTPANCSGAGPIGGTVTFKIITTEGTVVLGSALVGSDGKAVLEDTLLENQLYPGATNLLPTNGPLKPGNKTVTAVYTNTDADYIVTNPTAPLVVTCEDAEITYNGLNYFGANPNTSQGTITVSAFVLDLNDVNDVPAQARGDIRNATVTFKEGSSGGSAIGTANIPVGLVNPTNFQEGIVTTDKTYTLTTQDINCGGKIVEVWAGVNNYYCGEFAEVVPVCLSLPGGDFVTGGGWIKMQNSEGSYAGTEDKKMHAAIVFKWNKSNKNLQGNATIIYKRVVNGVQKVYQVKSNSLLSMIVNNVNDAGTPVTIGATYRMATISTKANFRDLTDPDFPVTLFGNLSLTITAWESIGITDGSKDRISIQLIGSGSQGLIFSSNWLNGSTKWQQLNSGKMRVRNPSAEITCTNCSGSAITATKEANKATEVTPEVIEDLKVVAMPNPSSTNFTIIVKGNNQKDAIKMVVADMYGRIIETRALYNNQTIKLGDNYIPGTYMVKFVQGEQGRQLKLIKLSE